ncbi:hypothetical protein CWN88_00570 [Vibrio splendidus]|nr:hypothetical protein CWN82_05880 [Vibrio splendidus]PTP06793.1 hypothetical protein CWN88_00570 [Vibrio splendidus]PTQ11275.1 hypothetical protein CWO28_00980 [Vibrio splendidus]
MTLKSTEIIGKTIKVFLLFVLVFAYYDTSYITLILVFFTYMGVTDNIVSKRLDDIERKLNSHKNKH